MSKFDNLNKGDVIIVTGIDENLLECDGDGYDTLLGVMQQPCEVLEIDDDIQLWSNCRMRSQKGVLIKSPKLQGHDGGGRCPEFNCYWIGRDYVNFEPLSYSETTDIFDKLNESEENIKEISHNDLEVGMNVFVNGDDGMGRSWDNEVGKVVYNWNEEEDNTSNSFTIAFNNNYNGHDNDSNAHECVNNNCWNFYDDCAYSDHKYCQNIEKISFYTIDSYSLFNNLNESDEFGWAEEIIKDAPNLVDYRTVKQGDKVVPGKDWMFGNQAQGSVYGIVDLEQYGGEPAYIEDSTDEEFHQYWVHVDWVDKNDNPNFRNNYRVGPNYYDLKYYVPKPINIKESVDDFDWVEDVINADLKFGVVKNDLKISDVITLTGIITDSDGVPFLELDEEPFLVVKNKKFDDEKPSPKSYIIELNWFNPSSKRPSRWQQASMQSNNGKDIISFTKETSKWDDELIVKFLKK